ncbi:probable 26S proteasome non-ATPase regulatory subunit p58 [Sporisorium reilianum f. sp. reilianum]|uniref:Probable 26S proteasome non-ATPase regulatory subunit p58 n=1 Tax=Sporisorium reilianum f. sp. reilianum TaxID=72559 RepID=A0A2N8UFG1_9BASI|nr:probable 26S proteasome non-ATPase regulatory subunit p58 [Sporisorium reilianum f. sp. reilianum]
MPEPVKASKEDVPAASTAKTADAAAVKPPSEKEQLLALLRHNFLLIERSVSHIEQRFTARVLRTLPYVRRKVNAYPEVLALAVHEGILAGAQDNASIQKHLLTFLPHPYKPEPPSASTNAAAASSDAMDVDSAEPKASAEATKDAKPTSTAASPAKPAQRQPEAQPELVAYLRLLTLVHLIDNKKLDAASNEAVASISTITQQNRRTLDHLAAKTIFYLGRAEELKAEHHAKSKGGARVEGGLTAIRSQLLGLQRTASLRHDAETEATIINLLLRSYIVEANLYDQADKLVARAPFPRSSASNPQVARYDYYVGRIRAVQLDYTQAHVHLQQAIRRAPQVSLPQESSAAGSDGAAAATATATAAVTAKPAVADKKDAASNKESSPVGQSQTAAGFLQTAHKFLVVVELLMGEIPERSIFRTPVLRKALAPYMEIVQAVRVGDLQRFQSTLQKHTALFQTDKTLSLIVRLRHNVIKTGIRMISLSYSRISLADITHKLHLESEEDAEYIVAKAIRDNVVDSRDTRVDHEKAEMVNRETKDLYETDEPMQQFQQRIQFCLQLHNESVKAMRYPLNGHKAELNSVAEAHERERELAAEIADGEMDDSDDDWA